MRCPAQVLSNSLEQRRQWRFLTASVTVSVGVSSTRMFSMGPNMAANAPNYQPSPRSAGLHRAPLKGPRKARKIGRKSAIQGGFCRKTAAADRLARIVAGSRGG
jgi:hypothetical protein